MLALKNIMYRIKFLPSNSPKKTRWKNRLCKFLTPQQAENTSCHGTTKKLRHAPQPAPIDLLEKHPHPSTNMETPKVG